MDLLDTYYGGYRDHDRISKFNINYDLFNGRLDVGLYDESIGVNIENEKVKFDFNTITHYPLISQVANAMHGEMISRPFKPMAKDIGASAQTLRNKKWNEMLRELIEGDIIAPMRDQITQAYMQQHNIADMFQLSPEEFQQMQSDIGQRLKTKTPDEILDFMQNDFQTPTQRQAQQLLDYFVVHQDIPYKHQQGFKLAIATAEEYYYIGDRNGEPVFENVNPGYFEWGGSQNTEWSQNGAWCKYEQWRSIEETTQLYSQFFTKSIYDELDGIAEPIGGRYSGVGDPRKDRVQALTMYEVSQEHGVIAKKYGDINYRTNSGQKDIVRLYNDVIAKYGGEHGKSLGAYGIRESHICWRDKRKLYRVIREIDGKKQTFWQNEHYEPKNEDYEVKEIWVDEVWEGTKLGSTGGDDIYLNIRPIPGQYKSIFNPYGVQLPYIGRKYNTHMNNSKNVSIIDLGKPWQKEFDVTMAQVKHDMATDMGNVFLMSLGWKPDNWKWQDWFDVMRNGKVLMAQLQKHGYGNIDPNLLRSINLSKSADIANKIQLMNYFRDNLVRAMNFNETRIGSIGQYTTQSNIQQSQSASYNQTEGYFETHRKIVEKALNAFMNRAKLVYRNNNKTKFILDDVARTELEVSPDFWYEEWAVEFTTSSEEIRKVEELRGQLQAFVQNQMSFDGVLALTLANTPNDIINIMKKETKRQEEMRQQQMQQQQEQFNAQMQAQKEKDEADRKYKYELEMAKLQSQETRTRLDREKFRMQADVDGNNRADALEKSIFEGEIKLGIEQAKLNLEKQKHEDEVRLKEMELQIKAGKLRVDKDKNDKDDKRGEEEIKIKKQQLQSKPTNKNN